jgi:phenylalanyl-tRNA synthetase alpha chain
MHDLIASVRAAAAADIDAVASPEQLDEFRVRYLARKGQVAALFDRLRDVTAAERPALGKALNDLRFAVQALHDAKARTFSPAEPGRRSTDLTLPGRPRYIGSRHPLVRTIDEISRIFVAMGFGIADGPEIEDDEHNFTALNFPPEHPARDMQDTFFLSRSALLRTHTSPVQIRVMKTHRPPLRVIMPGKVYRNEAVSTRSLAAFHQVEGLYVDRHVTFSELKGTLVEFARRFYGRDIRYRFRPSFFPFTEPSAEMYITCFLCKGKGCRMCKHTGWLEVLGCGMVDPNVLRGVGIDPEVYTGYAFGMGIDRTAALRYGVDDIRLFYENDIRFLNQF